MSDDTRRVLDLLAQGKVTVDEADQLLRAMQTPRAEPSDAGDAAGPQRARYLRIAIHKASNGHRPEKDVKIRVPIGIVRSGMRLGALIPGLGGERVTQRLREHGLDVDLSKLNDAQLDALLKNLGEVTIDVDDGQAQVRIVCE